MKTGESLFVSNRWSERLLGEMRTYKVRWVACNAESVVSNRGELEVCVTNRALVKAVACRQLRKLGHISASDRVHMDVVNVETLECERELRCDAVLPVLLFAFGAGGLAAGVAMTVIWWVTGWLESKERKGGRKL